MGFLPESIRSGTAERQPTAEVAFFWNSRCEKGDPGRPGVKALASDRLAAVTPAEFPPEEMER
jgi:hypothetical protein